MADINQIVESLKKAMEDYSQLKRGYPNAQKFLNAFVENVKKVAPPNPMDTQASQEYAMNRAFDAPMLGAIKAYHGSPHRFDKFDMGKIGTGEGAQSYGHGLYFADRKDTAQHYAEKLINDASLPKADNQAEEYVLEKIKAYRDELGASPDKTDIYQWINSDGKLINDEYDNFNYNEVIDSLDNIYNKLPRSNVYEASLQWPDAAREATDPLGPQHFLDWDKPLGEQPDSIRQLIPGRETQNPIKAIYQAFSNGDKWAMDWAKEQGLNPYSAEFGVLTADELSSMYLKSKGIPGTRYLDQGSRGAGEGTYNYVVFDDNIPKIISINGKGLLGEVKR